MSEQIKPDYYQNTFPDGRVWDVIDIAAAMKLPFTLSLALKYFRKSHCYFVSYKLFLHNQ